MEMPAESSRSGATSPVVAVSAEPHGLAAGELEALDRADRPAAPDEDLSTLSNDQLQQKLRLEAKAREVCDLLRPAP